MGKQNIELIKRTSFMKTNKKSKCYNCLFASKAFKIAGKTHHQCNHPKNEKGFNDGVLTAWDTLQEFYNTCNDHKFRQSNEKITNQPHLPNRRNHHRHLPIQNGIKPSDYSVRKVY